MNAWFTLEDGAEPFGSTVNTINIVIEEYRGVVRGRGKMGMNG
jgi:hypothetical protein